MSDLVAIAYPDERRAAEVMSGIKRLEADDTIDLEDAVAVAKDGEGRIKVEGATSGTAAGAAGGLVLGTVIGLVFVAPVVGALFGAASGALAGKLADTYRLDDFLIEIGDNMPPGSSVILMLVRKTDPDKTLAELQRYGGKVIRTSLPDDAEERIRAALGQAGASAN